MLLAIAIQSSPPQPTPTGRWSPATSDLMLLVRSPLPSATASTFDLQSPRTRYLSPFNHPTPALDCSRPPTPLRSPGFLSPSTAPSTAPNPRKRSFTPTSSHHAAAPAHANLIAPEPIYPPACQRQAKRARTDLDNNGAANRILDQEEPLASNPRETASGTTPLIEQIHTTQRVYNIMDIHMNEEDKVFPTFSTSRPTLLRLSSFEAGLDAHSKRDDTAADMPSSPPSLPPVMQLKRNPKKLSLTLPSAPHCTPSPSGSTPSTVCPTPTLSTHNESDSRFSTPYTPGPPKTPALAMSLGRASLGGKRRPSLLSLITQPPAAGDDEPCTPGAGGSHPYATMRMRGKGRARSYTTAEMMNLDEADKGTRSSLPLSTSFPAINEAEASTQTAGLSALGYALPSTSTHSPSPTSTSTSASDSASTSTTPSTSPPLPTTFTFSMPLTYPTRQPEPYDNGPIEIIPGVFLGAEESVFQFSAYANNQRRVRIVNVAQEVDDPFDASFTSTPGWTMPKGKGKEKMKLAQYPGNGGDRPNVEYCHVRWSHGELGLADVPEGASLEDILHPSAPTSTESMWEFWETIRWMEQGRRQGIPILIHCQCGVSRSATLAIAYTMALAASGAMPEFLGHIRAMQDAYDFIKSKSSWIGPNHSLVFQLVDFARTLTSLLSAYVSSHPNSRIITSFPSSSDAELSEAEWARRRREFEESEEGGAAPASGSGDSVSTRDGSAECISPEEAGDEARRLDEAMLLRRERIRREVV